MPNGSRLKYISKYVWVCLQTGYPKISLLITISLVEWLYLGVKSPMFRQTQTVGYIMSTVVVFN